jgi:hypothetical protein
MYICVDCAQVGSEKFEEEQRGMWGNLPALFELEGWNEVEEGVVDALEVMFSLRLLNVMEGCCIK